jgi:hypothetical protein
MHPMPLQKKMDEDIVLSRINSQHREEQLLDKCLKYLT